MSTIHQCCPPRKGMSSTPLGEFGDEWWCECGKLWRIEKPQRRIGQTADVKIWMRVFGRTT